MRVFQNVNAYPDYLSVFRSKLSADASFEEQMQAFLDDRCSAMHILSPPEEANAHIFLTHGADRCLQQRWALENGLPKSATPDAIMLAQVEAHRAEVYYDLAPGARGEGFLRRLPGCVRRTIAWHASPGAPASLPDYDLVVSNFPLLLQAHESAGCRVALFFPAHDPVMNTYAANRDRPVDVMFVGSYSRHHARRASVLEAFAYVREGWEIGFHINRARLVKLAESPLLRLLPLNSWRRSPALRRRSSAPLFGRSLYEAFSRSKIVLNVAGEIAGEERGNMRCFEAMGCGAALLSDDGIYPAGMEPGANLVTFASAVDAVQRARELLQDEGHRRSVADKGHSSVAETYSRDRQWRAFAELAG
jgi:hypothetical protein